MPNELSQRVYVHDVTHQDPAVKFADAQQAIGTYWLRLRLTIGKVAPTDVSQRSDCILGASEYEDDDT